MSKGTNKPSASTWRRLDAAYRAEQKKRRAANAARRQARLDAMTTSGAADGSDNDG